MAGDEHAAEDAIPIAICLGWRLAELYDSESIGSADGALSHELLPPHLPGLGEMTANEKACALAAHVSADLTSLAAAVSVRMPRADAVRALIAGGHAMDDVRRAVLALYVDIRDRLAGSNVAAATGFGLGRMLADTALLPTSDKPQLIVEQFDIHRLENGVGWLDDLDSRLPAHAAAAVRTSLKAWQLWVEKLHPAGGTIDPAKIDAKIIRELRRQGDLWRRLLTGEQAADQLLDERAYVSAAAMLLANARRLAFHYLWKWSWAILLAAAAAGAAVWAAVTYAPAGAERTSAVLFSAASFLGISWVGARETFGRALGQAESALWQAEVAAAIGKAATLTPVNGKKRTELGASAARPEHDNARRPATDDNPASSSQPLTSQPASNTTG